MKDRGRLQEISRALFRRLFPCPDDLESVFITCVFIGVFSSWFFCF